MRDKPVLRPVFVPTLEHPDAAAKVKTDKAQVEEDAMLQISESGEADVEVHDPGCSEVWPYVLCEGDYFLKVK